MPTSAFGNWMNDFMAPARDFMASAGDFTNSVDSVFDAGKQALDTFGFTPFLESALTGRPASLDQFFNSDYNYLDDTVLGQAGKAFFNGDQSVLDSILDGSFDYSGFLSSLNDGGILGAQPVNRNNAYGIGGSPVSPAVNDYINAELASFYGMDRNTAYQEALANTSYQRAVKDMQAAGLNPAAIFGNGRGSTASGVAYVGSQNSSSGVGSNSKLFSSDDFGLIASLAGLATAVATKKPSNFWLGQQGAQAVMTVLNGLEKKYK